MEPNAFAFPVSMLAIPSVEVAAFAAQRRTESQAGKAALEQLQSDAEQIGKLLFAAQDQDGE